ncbi:hypothetical protein [[Mycoplasma] collis]|uniref:hypothetical protein n=1 Tax=[Mycoplasma] collis TaxID=2127 RepID=UPI00051AFC65|nr:hypothetical protein [[Mycoplasma] collis]
MKKNKLLFPILALSSVALATTVVACSKNNDDSKDNDNKDDDNKDQSKTIDISKFDRIIRFSRKSTKDKSTLFFNNTWNKFKLRKNYTIVLKEKNDETKTKTSISDYKKISDTIGYGLTFDFKDENALEEKVYIISSIKEENNEIELIDQINLTTEEKELSIPFGANKNANKVLKNFNVGTFNKNNFKKNNLPIFVNGLNEKYSKEAKVKYELIISKGNDSHTKQASFYENKNKNKILRFDFEASIIEDDDATWEIKSFKKLKDAEVANDQEIDILAEITDEKLKKIVIKGKNSSSKKPSTKKTNS